MPGMRKYRRQVEEIPGINSLQSLLRFIEDPDSYHKRVDELEKITAEARKWVEAACKLEQVDELYAQAQDAVAKAETEAEKRIEKAEKEIAAKRSKLNSDIAAEEVKLVDRSAELDELQKALHLERHKLAEDQKAHAAAIKAKRAELNDREKKLVAREAEVTRRETDLTRREAAVERAKAETDEIRRKARELVG